MGPLFLKCKKKICELTKLYTFSVFSHIDHVKKVRRAVEITLCLQGLNVQLRFSTLTEKAVSLYDNNITKNHEVQSDMMTFTLAICQTVF